MIATALLWSIAIGCSNHSPVASSSSDVPHTTALGASGPRRPCASDEVAVAVKFATAVQAHDASAFSACESATTQPAADLVSQLAGFGTLVLDRASPQGGGNSVDIPSPPIPNGDLPPHQCGVLILGTFETGGWFVTGVQFYCSA